ncbi:MAG TPA: 30S ribosomal protein S17 [bacterium]|nr:30S ribosomal protein S17 [bacterium]HOL49383.1 30S ribosomal protein S17 [bacterium]HPO51404.1 30S ribosomal protein S17 [bacterium]HXK44953.1 30S ribosomal protein S17 [bacterium]
MVPKQENKIEKQGQVVSDKMEKTRVVVVETLSRHPVYFKVIRKRKKFYVHDESEISKTGDTVIIRQCRPLSRLKRWRIVEVVKKASSKSEGVTNGAVKNNT